MTKRSRPTRARPAALAFTITIGLVAAACSSSGETTTPPDTEDAATTLAPTTEASTDPDPTTPPADSVEEPPSTDPVTAVTEDRAFYILPPGNYGGLPTNDDSFDQLDLYDGLTPLRGDVTDADIEAFFLPADFAPIGDTTEEPTGRAGTTILYDDFGVAHITGETREDLAFGAGWVTARDRGLLLELGRGPARAALADIPGIDAFSLVTSAQSFTPSAATEQLVTDQIQLIIDTYPDEGEEIIADTQAYADGATAYNEANDVAAAPFTVNDIIATTAFIGSIFGAGGGAEARNAEFLAQLESALGEEQGRLVWEDFMPTDDPEAPTTLDERFDYPALTGGDVTGSVPIDAGSLISLDPTAPADGSTPVVEASVPDGVLYSAAGGPLLRNASNWLLASPDASVNDTTLAVMGPQLGYYYPEIVQQIHLTGPGIEAQGAAVPGLAMYLLIGRTEDYAWSLTSANQDVRDIYAEMLCEPDGAAASRASTHYEFEGECVPFELFDAGTLGDTPITYPVSVHGPVVGTATSEGVPIALTSKRSTFGRDGLNLAALKDMTEGDADTPEAFFESANRFGFTFNWGYANREGVGYFASGYLPVRAEGLDRRLPTLGTGDYEWQGFLEQDEHPHADGHPSGRLLNWNNQSAPGFMHGDNNQYGSVHRVENFDQWPDEVELSGVVGVMNRAATEDTRSSVWPVISDVLAESEAPSELSATAVESIGAWIADDAPILDADNDGQYDVAGPLLLDTVFDPIADAVAAPVLAAAIDADIDFQGIDMQSFVDKDLRTLLGQPVEGAFNIAYCGGGDLIACSEALWASIDEALSVVAVERGDDPTTWLDDGERTTFVPGLVPNDFRRTNRPTFQQVIEFAPEG